MAFQDSIKNELATVEKEIEMLVPKQPKEVYEMLFPFIQRGGKRIRPMLLLLCCEAVGGDKSKAIRPAALIEMFHSFTLIHDDICDDSLMRRGLPTLHVQYGIPIAINAGDALYTLLWRGLSTLELQDSNRDQIMKMSAEAFLKVVEGQGIELEWYRKKRFDVGEEEYMRMVGGKTAALIGLSCELGAVIGNANETTKKALRNFGINLGLAFQIRDDVLNLVGNFEEYQKEIGGDITEGKRTLMVAHTLDAADKKDRAELIDILGKGTRKKTDITRAIELLQKYGAMDYASKKAEELAIAAERDLDAIPDSPTKQSLLELKDFVVSRRQ